MQSGGGVDSGPEAAKITFLIKKNSRYKTGTKEHHRSGFTFPLCV